MMGRIGMVALLAGCQMATAGSTLGPHGGGDAGEHAVPQLFGMTHAQAEAAARAAGFTPPLEDETQAACGSLVDGKVVELGTICGQQPVAGQAARADMTIRVRVQRENPWRGVGSNGEGWFLMPPVVGLTLDDARTKLRTAGFSVADRIHVTAVEDPACRPNVVCRTYPDAMTRSSLSSDKSLVIGMDPTTRPPAPPAPPPTENGAPPPPAPKQTSLGDLF
ncbi:MAG TPA: PASTA domain-containing protein [Kofleriaceae bacterium]|jgi:beta-lactam-binding protein with PASTA domain